MFVALTQNGMPPSQLQGKVTSRSPPPCCFFFLWEPPAISPANPFGGAFLDEKGDFWGEDMGPAGVFLTGFVPSFLIFKRIFSP
ncbi:hypothetical protein CHS0354_037250 [Potamilus streckersoni]|uniref:Uncharacterized protein n=1 Tax=Potamilus streckersoni TaxID=2493646 RepID=A0AAE0SX90_9BIVA|nr:hypothetical protein CHS0354_037250 [Potamilus streckersoni]